MPYKGEVAGKGGHSDFVRNPDVADFLAECDYMKEPGEAEAKAMASSFSSAPTENGSALPRFVVASDASKSDTPISDRLPSTQVGFVKVSQVLIGMEKYGELIDPNTRFVDPFKVAEMHRNASAITYTLPGSNVRFQGAKSVKDGFRRAVFKQLNANRSQGENKLILVNTLLTLCNGEIEIEKCPSCSERITFKFSAAQLEATCGQCGEPVFITDWLRIHEDVSDFGNNTSAITRLMNVVEHLLLITLVDQVFNANPRALASMAFVMDGPLALFGQPAKLHAKIMSYLHRVNSRLASLSLDPLLVVGLQKTGEVMDHANLLNRFLPPGVLRVIDDEYRYKYIKGSNEQGGNFGSETYYGQDFLFKTERGRIFTFAVPYPFEDKANSDTSFARKKVDLSKYGNSVSRACDLIRHFELNLYESAVVPIALAHRHASISIVPGGKVLDIITKTGLKTDST
tara:strand:+ start:1651 stop:3021 length:1371 start_codon:yes stop_codon:yes gene_type:complete